MAVEIDETVSTIAAGDDELSLVVYTGTTVRLMH